MMATDARALAAPLLAITIPTYNRSELLGTLLDSISQDFPTWPEGLEVIVLDNASTDDTRAQVQARIDRGVPIRLRTHPTNLGMDANLAACFDATEAKYLWQIGDDEVLHQGACRYVLDFARQHEFGLLHIECIGFSKGQQPVQLARAIPDRVTVRPLSSTAMFRQANVYLTFISANVINRHALRARYPAFDPRSEMNTFLPQLAWIYGVLKASVRHFHVRTPLFGALGGNTSGYRLVEVFGVNLLAITERQLGGVIPHARRTMANAVLTRLLPGELVSLSRVAATEGNKFEAEDLERALDHAFGRSFCLRWGTKPLLSASALCRWVAFFAVRAFNKINRALNYIWL
jgi:glycosyltransferase involved in cell wall biosynthesis